MTTQTEPYRTFDDAVEAMYQLARELDRARVNLLDAYADCGRGRISSVRLFEQAYTVACKRLAAAQLESEAAQTTAVILSEKDQGK